MRGLLRRVRYLLPRRARRFGSAALAADRAHDVWVPPALQGIGQDLRLAVHTLWSVRLVSAVAVLSLALGIGANTAIFSLIDSLLLRALPVKDPGRLVLLAGALDPSAGANGAADSWSYPVWNQIRQHADLFESAAAWSPAVRTNVRINGARAEQADGFFASGSFFETLGVPMALGRPLVRPDDRRGGGPDGPVAVLSYGYWQRRFGAADVIGRTLTIENVPFTVVGVTAPAFFGPEVGRTFDVVVPFGDEPLVSRNESRLDQRNAAWVLVGARLEPDQSAEAATRALRGLQAQIREATLPEHWPAPALDGYLRAPFTAVPAAAWGSSLRRRYERPLLTVMVIVGFVLLIACANVANLLLARTVARQHELSLRVALGASRWRLGRQLLAESAVLAGMAALLGIVIAAWGSRLLVGQLSGQTGRVFLDLSPDWRVFGFMVAVTIATALLFGVAPALRACGAAPMGALKAHGPGAPGEARRGIASAAIAVQVALSVVLVVAAGLFVRTFVSLATRDLGFDSARVQIVTINAHSATIQPSQRVPLYQRARDAVIALPGVRTAALSLVTPVSGLTVDNIVQVSGGAPRSDLDRRCAVNFVSPAWFATLGTPLTAGRDFSNRDRKGTPPVAVVNQAFARRLLAGRSPIGHTISVTLAGPAPEPPIEVVGVAVDAVYRSVREPMPPTIYLPLAQHADLPFLGEISLSVRANAVPSGSLVKAVAAAIGGVNPELALAFQPLADQVSASLTQERLMALLSGFFGGLALLLAGLGLYGVTAYTVSRRQTEIGVRMALGASPAEIVRLVLSSVSRLVGVGVAVGAALSLWASTVVRSLLYGIEPDDPLTLAGAVGVLIVVAAIAAWLPARRAARIDPAVVLRSSQGSGSGGLRRNAC